MLLVLGRSNDEKGSQLEALTFTLVRAMGYTRITRNHIGPGGEEIDVRAELSTPSLAGSHRTGLLCECKAHRSPIALPDWLKFLGKVLSEELRPGAGRVRAFFIALSGVNGNVAGHYEELRRSRDDIVLVTGDDLLATIQQHFGLVPLEAISDLVRRSTDRQIRSVENAYYEGAVYWVVIFEHDMYTLLGAQGSPVPSELLATVAPMIEDVLPAHAHVDLNEEAAARARIEMTEKSLLASVLGEWDLPTEPLEAEPVETATPLEIELAVKHLEDRGWIGTGMHPEAARSLNREISRERLAQVYQFMLTWPIPGEVARLFGSPRHKEFVRTVLLDLATANQGGVVLSDEEKEDAIKIMQWSPSALSWALHPQQMLLNSLPDPAWDAKERGRIERTRTSIFLCHLFDGLAADFRRRGTRSLFLNQHGIQSLEITRRVVVRGADGIELDRTLRERMGLRVLADDYVAEDGTRVVNVIELDDDE